jgi:hypothetical protein
VNLNSPDNASIGQQIKRSSLETLGWVGIVMRILLVLLVLAAAAIALLIHFLPHFIQFSPLM